MKSEPEQSAAGTAAGSRSRSDRPPDALRVRCRGLQGTVALTDLDAVIDCPPVTPAPGSPGWLLGVATYRGGLLPVVDLAAARGDDEARSVQPGDRLLLVETGIHRIGFAVDEILAPDAPATADAASPIALRALAARLLRGPDGNPPDMITGAAAS